MIFEKPVVLYAGVRTAIGKLAGVHARVEPHQLLASAITGTLIRSVDPGVTDPEVIEKTRGELDEKQELISFDDVLIGNVRNSIGNIARVGALEAGLAPQTPAATIDRQCASSMEAVAIAGAKLNAGGGRRIIVGGVESASLAPWLYAKTPRPYHYFEPQPFQVRMSSQRVGDPNMGETAEIVADDFQVSREEMDAFALQSHQKAAAAQQDGFFDGEIWPYLGSLHDPLMPAASVDECVRPDSTLEKLAKLRPVFRKDGRVTAANASPLNDAANAAIACLPDDLPDHVKGHEILVRSITTVGLDPNRMGLGPALAIPALLKENNLSIDEIDLFEINEAFAGQVLGCFRHLEQNGIVIPAEKLNTNGGAIAIGHPMGATGLRLLTTLGRNLRKKGLKRGIASLCIGGGQGMAALVEVPD